MLNKTPLWRSTPPAIFPVALGFMGLALAWRNTAYISGVPEEIGDLMLGFSTAFFLFFAVSYLAKILARPKAVIDDLKMPAARAGVAAYPMAIMLLAAALLPLGVRPHEVWWIGVFVYYIATGLVAYSILAGPPEARKFSPFQYLAFVGPTVGPIAGIPLGHATESYWLLIAALFPYVGITLGYGVKLIRVRPPVQLRASIVIVLAPTSLFAMGFLQLDMMWAYEIFYWLSMVFAGVFLCIALWLTHGGWNPVWGSFTFPIATFTNLQVMTLAHGNSVIATAGLVVGLVIGTPLILYIVWMASRLWIRGELAKKTAASMA